MIPGGGALGVKTPTISEIFFNFLEFSQPPRKFFHSLQKNSNPLSLEKFLAMPLNDPNCHFIQKMSSFQKRKEKLSFS